ncbi:MAG: hypothetical protein JW862_11985 [Anaerolineales bacterium]|nr:hypothetical protein [Anaerolineales bacterium]
MDTATRQKLEQMGDFGIFEIVPVKTRLVVGFGQIYNLELADFLQPA